MENGRFQNLSCCGWPASLPAPLGDECCVPGGWGGAGGMGENTNLSMCPWLERLVFKFVQGEGEGRGHNTNLVMLRSMARASDGRFCVQGGE